MLACIGYIELIRFGRIAKNAAEYPWASFTFYAMGKPDELLTTHLLYDSLVLYAKTRAAAYGKLFSARMADNITQEIKAAWQTGTPLAHDRSNSRIETPINRKIGYEKGGRPVAGKSKKPRPIVSGLFKDR